MATREELEEHVNEAERNLEFESRTGEPLDEMNYILRSIASSLLVLAKRSMEF